MTQDRGYLDKFPQGTGVPDAFKESNLGVVLLRKSAVMIKVLENALAVYDRLGKRGRWLDQPALRLAAYSSELRVATLTAEYNCRFANFGQICGTVKVLHGRIPRGDHTEKALDAVLARLNSVTIPRVFVAGQVYALAHNTRPFSRPYVARRVACIFPSNFLYNVKRFMRLLLSR